MATTRILRKDLRRPDEFVSLTTRAVHYAQTHQRIVTWIAVALAAATLAAIALVSFRNARLQQANTSLARGMALFAEDKLPDAIRVFDELAAQPNTPEEFAELARLYSAQAQLKQGEFARAAAAFDAAQGGTEGFLEQRALLNHAYALEGNQQFGDAARHFDQAVSAGGPYSAVAILGAARNWQRSGDAAKAKEAYRRFLEKYPDSPDKALAEAELAALPE